MCIEDFCRNRTWTRPADKALCTVECARKSSSVIGNGIDILIGRCVQGNGH